MKKVIICFVLAMMSVAGYTQSVIGKWVTEGGESQVEIYQSGDKLNGKIVWLKKGDGQLAHQERRQVGRRKDLQPQKRQDLQVFHLARRQQPEGSWLRRYVLRNPDLDKKVNTASQSVRPFVSESIEFR